MTHGWVIPTLIWHKIITINTSIKILGGNVGCPRTHNTFTIKSTITFTITNTKWIILTKWWLHGWFCTLLMRRTKPQIMPVSDKTIFWGVEVGVTGTNTTSTITISIIMIPPTNIWQRIGPVFVWLTHVWILTSLIWHKLTTINTTINFLGGNMGGHRTHTTFTISITNTKWSITISINWIILTELLSHGRFCELLLRQTKPYSMPVSEITIFLEGELVVTRTNTTSTITIRNKIILLPYIWRRIGPIFV